MNPSDAIEAIEKPLSSLPYSLSRHILEHLRKLTSHEPVIGIMGKSGAGKSSLCNALFQGEVTPVSDVHAGTRECCMKYGIIIEQAAVCLISIHFCIPVLNRGNAHLNPVYPES
ncbi:putative GTP-binding protein [Escherichia coli]|nr:putative GTP-binding protein [Escherichia coli]